MLGRTASHCGDQDHRLQKPSRRRRRTKRTRGTGGRSPGEGRAGAESEGAGEERLCPSSWVTPPASWWGRLSGGGRGGGRGEACESHAAFRAAPRPRDPRPRDQTSRHRRRQRPRPVERLEEARRCTTNSMLESVVEFQHPLSRINSLINYEGRT